MVDLTLLKTKYGTSNARLREIFTREKPENWDKLKEEEQKAIERDMATRCRVEKILQDRLMESINYNLRHAEIYEAVDLAWDAAPINKGTIPLMMYAQGKLDKTKCAASLTKAGFGRYVTKDDKGTLEIDLPKFYECQVNLIRSILTRRLAAQSNKYANLFPYFKYEARGTSLPEKLAADLVSQRMDIMADQYDHRHHEVQVMRDVLLYAQSVDFVRSSWECEKQERFKKVPAGVESTETEVRIVKEGLAFVNPHPSRVFWDVAYGLPSLNSDTGCEWVGYWDVVRYKDVEHNPAYWNRTKVGYTSQTNGLFESYAQYFSAYYCTITPPTPVGLAAPNDRENNVGYYASNMGDSSMVLANFFWKIRPSEWGLGDYPHEVWVRFVLAGEQTVLFAEYLPSSPCAVASHNCNDHRLINISFAHELMSYQDQLSNLWTHLLMCLSADHIKVLLIDKDIADPDHILKFRQQIRASYSDPSTVVLEISRSKMAEFGVTDPEKVISLVETRSFAIDSIMQAISTLMSLVERMAALSPQEQGQPAPREISATESNMIAGTTESVYGFISDTIDEYRAAKKRILYESWVMMGQETFELPVVARYPRDVILQAGFEAVGSEYLMDTGLARYNVRGEKRALSENDFVFTSRDGAERPVNTQAASTMVQLLQVLTSMPQVLQSLDKEQLFGMVNEIFRQSGAHNLVLEVQPGDTPKLGPDPTELVNQMNGNMEGLTSAAEQNKGEIEQIKAALEQMQGGGGGMPQMPQAMPNAMPEGMPQAMPQVAA